MYETRSKILHGQAIPDPVPIQDMADEMETLVIRSLRAFLLERTDLVHSSHRWKKIFLQDQ